MKLSELMSGVVVDPAFEGVVTNDDNVLAVGIGDETDTVADYVVVQNAIEGVDSALNPTTSNKTYIRAGLSTTKTGEQRSFSVTGDRFIGDAFQDYVFSLPIMYGRGAAVVVPYVWFSLKNGKGEKGTVSIIANSDGSGAAGETAGIDIGLNKFGSTPELFTWPVS